MSVSLTKQRNGWWLHTPLFLFLAVMFAVIIPFVSDVDAATSDWYRLRTNSVPYQPYTVALDSSGGLWVTALDETEYAPGVWYRPAGAVAVPPFQYITNNQNNNLVGAGFNPPIVKPQLSASILYAIKDNAGNTWYSLKNRTVLCQKPDSSWLTFNMPDSSSIQVGVDTTNVDSAHRIRLIDKPGGTQEILLIAARGVVRISAALSVVETRAVYSPYNNDFIKDALVDSQGRYWVTSERGVEKGTSLVSTEYVATLFPSDPNAASGATITRIVEDSLGNIWFGSDMYGGDGIYRYSSTGAWTKFDDGVVATIGKNVHDIAAASDGSVWFGAMYYDNSDISTGGLLRYTPDDGGQWTHYPQSDLGLESGEVISLVSDSTGLWFTTAYNSSITGNGTGVHYLSFNQFGEPDVTHYTYRGNSTTLTSLRFENIAADMSGGLWLPSYDDPSIARLKTDGTWQQFRQDGNGNFGSFGIRGVAVDSTNKVYFAPLRSAPIAYDVATDQWLNLPAAPFNDFFYYGVYVDPQDGKWFYGAYGVYYLNPGNTAWTTFSPAEIPGFPTSYDYFVEGVLVDDAGNAWFMCRSEVVLMKRNLAGGDPSWYKFESGDSSGYSAGYRVFQDDTGQIWNAAKQKFDTNTNTWATVADTSVFDQRKLRFLNGRVPATMDMTEALTPAELDERLMTVDTQGTIYFSGGLGVVRAGIIAFGPQALPTVTVTATASGTGTGTVSSSPSGISYTYNSSTSGAAAVNSGATVVLTATASGGSTVVWSNCAANGGVVGGTTSVATCTVSSVAAAKSVAAAFTLKPNLTVALDGTGGGSVFSTPEGIDCPAADCSAPFDNDSSVTLTATPNSSSTFVSWSGCTSATGACCSVTMDSSKSVTATFNSAKAQIGTTGYATLAAAHTAAASGAQILLLDGDLAESLTVEKSVTLKGGYNATFSGLTGLFSNLTAPLVISSGTLTVDRIVVK